MQKSNVIQFAKHTHPPLRQLDTYWNALAEAKNAIPRRSNIDPTGVSGALSSIFLIDRIANAQAKFRIAGTDVNSVFGQDAKGLPLSLMITPRCRGALQDQLYDLFINERIQSFNLSAQGRFLQPKYKVRIEIYPLHDDMGRCTCAIGALEFIGKRPKNTLQFDIVPQADFYTIPNYDLPASNFSSQQFHNLSKSTASYLRLVK